MEGWRSRLYRRFACWLFTNSQVSSTKYNQRREPVSDNNSREYRPGRADPQHGHVPRSKSQPRWRGAGQHPHRNRRKATLPMEHRTIETPPRRRNPISPTQVRSSHPLRHTIRPLVLTQTRRHPPIPRSIQPPRRPRSIPLHNSSSRSMGPGHEIRRDSSRPLLATPLVLPVGLLHRDILAHGL